MDTALDRASLLSVFAALDPQDVVHAQLASTRLLCVGRSPGLWLRHLAEQYGLHLVCGAVD